MSIVDDNTLRALVAKTIFEHLPAEQREKLMVDAIAKLMEPEKNVYGQRTPSILESAFRQTVSDVARRELFEICRVDERIKTLARDLAQKAIEKFIATDTDKLADGMADGMRRALGRDF